MGPAIEDVGSTWHSSTAAFHLSIPTNSVQYISATAPLIQSRLDRDSGIAYLAENMCGGPLGEGILRLSSSSSHRQTHGGT